MPIEVITGGGFLVFVLFMIIVGGHTK